RQLGMLRRVDAIQSSGHHGNGRRGTLQRAAVRRGIDATRQPADYYDAGAPELTRQPVRGAAAIRSVPTRSGDRDHGLRPRPAAEVEPRRRIVDLLEE